MKNLIFIDGASCVGKTTICEELFEMDTLCAYLDADWTRYINPYTKMTDEIRNARTKTISLILRNYIMYEDVNNIYLSWIMRGDKSIRESITNELNDLEFNVYCFLLKCSEKEYRIRMGKKHIGEKQQNANIEFAESFNTENQIIIDVSNLNAEQAAEIILENVPHK